MIQRESTFRSRWRAAQKTLQSLIACTLLFWAPSSEASGLYEDESPSVFDQGRSHGSILVGSSSNTSGEYHLIVGAGYGYFIADGLDLRLDADMTLGRDPFVGRTTPGIQYILHFIPGIQPYVGGFYRHWFIGSGEDDMDSVGARFGGIFVQGARTYIQVGLVWENIIKNCRDGDPCSYTIPEIMMSLAF